MLDLDGLHFSHFCVWPRENCSCWCMGSWERWCCLWQLRFVQHLSLHTTQILQEGVLGIAWNHRTLHGNTELRGATWRGPTDWWTCTSIHQNDFKIQKISLWTCCNFTASLYQPTNDVLSPVPQSSTYWILVTDQGFTLRQAQKFL